MFTTLVDVTRPTPLWEDPSAEAQERVWLSAPAYIARLTEMDNAARVDPRLRGLYPGWPVSPFFQTALKPVLWVQEWRDPYEFMADTCDGLRRLPSSAWTITPTPDGYEIYINKDKMGKGPMPLVNLYSQDGCYYFRTDTLDDTLRAAILMVTEH